MRSMQMDFFKITKSEISQLLSNKFTRIAILVVCGIPLLYSFLYLYAFWDPYGKLDKLPVAVVNLDEGATYQGKVYNFGDQLENTLRKNKNADWKFVSKTEALYGLDHKEYYMVVKVPDGFSSNILSVNSANPRRANLEFITNQGSNYLASQISNRIIDEIKNNLSTQISQNYIDNIFSQISSSSGDLAKAGSGAQKITAGIGQAVSGSKQISNGLSRTYNANNRLLSGTNQMVSGTTDLENGLSKTGQASKTLAQKTGEAKDGLGAISNGLQQTKNGSALLATKLKDGSNAGIALGQGLQAAGNGASKLTEGSNSLSLGVQTISNGIGSLATGMSQISTSLDSGTAQLEQANDKLTSGTGQLKGSLNQFDSGLNQINSGIHSSRDCLQTVEENLNAYVKQHPEAASDPNLTMALKILEKNNGPDGLQKASEGLAQSHDILSGQISPAVEQINVGQKQLGQGIQQMSTQTNTVINGTMIPAANSMKSSLDTQILPGFNTLTQKSNELTNGLKTMTDGSHQLTSGLQTASTKLTDLSNGSTQMYNGSKKLLTGLNALQTNMEAVSTAQNKMAEGARSINGGLNKSASGLKSLNKGVAQMENGQNSLSSGLSVLKTGSGTLASKLTDSANVAKLNTKSSVTGAKSTVMAQPVDLKDESIHKVNQYGSGFAPYFIPLSLWVGALMIFFVVEPKKMYPGITNKVHLAIANYLTVALISSCQALVTSFVIRNVLKLAVTSSWKFYLFNIMMSLVFVAIVQFLVTTLGIAGRFIGLVLLMLQLTSAGGTFPVELVPRFFQVLHPFLPMSHGVDGLRAIISGSDPSSLATNVTILIMIGIVFLILTILSYVSPLFAKLKLPEQVSV